MPTPIPAHAEARQILLVDDDEGVRVALGGQLEMEGYDVTTAEDGSEALELLRRRRFPVIISDQHMPGMTGLELLARAREMQPHASRILLTGVVSLPTLVKAINEGELYRFIGKPWDRADLTAIVQHAIQRHDLLEANERLRADTARLNEELTAQLALAQTQNRLLAEAQEALAENFEHSLGLCHRVMTTYVPMLGKRTRAVVDLCRRMAGMPGDSFTKNERHILITAAWLHDIGLIGVRRALLTQFYAEPDGCSEAEWRELRQHPIYGQTLAAFVDPLVSVGETIRAHHERWDGSGYPDRLAGEAIPWTARCLAVAAAFAGASPVREEAIGTLARQAGTAFDPEAVRLLAAAVEISPQPRSVNEVDLPDLVPGMQLAKGIYSSSGLLLMAAGEELTPTAIIRLRENGLLAGARGRLLVYR